MGQQQRSWMMAQAVDRKAQQEAVTPERFASAKTYADYLGTITQNQQKFADNYAKTAITEAQTARLEALSARPGGPAKVLVIGEDWCPDVYRGLPVLQRIAEAAGWDLRVLERDQHLDVAEHFKKDGQFLSVPTAIFYTGDLQYILHWIERPERVTAEMADVMRPLFAAYTPQALAAKLGHEPTEAEKAAAAKERGEKNDEFQATNPAWARWRGVTVEDVIERLEHATR
jgi:hypothetical protein